MDHACVCLDSVRIGRQASRHENIPTIIKTMVFNPSFFMIFTRFACHYGALYALYVVTDDDVCVASLFDV